jgi:hypothetical protein
MKRDLLPAVDALSAALEDYDDAQARALLEDLIEWLGVDVVATEVVPLLLRVLKRRWLCNQACLAQRDFACGTLKDCLLQFAQGWAQGQGPRAILASTSGLQREISLIGFGLALRRCGWRISYLGCDAPIAILIDTVRALGPRLVALSLPPDATPGQVSPELRALAAEVPMAIFGASLPLADSLGAMPIGDDLNAEARRATITALASIA